MPQTRSPAAFYNGDHYDNQQSIAYRLHQLMSAMRRDIERRMTAHDLTAAQWLPLWKLKQGACHNAQQIACDLNIDPGAVTRLIDRLQAKGLIERVRSESDRRVVNLALTEPGAEVAQHIPHALAEVNNTFLSGFSQAEWQQLISLLDRMLANTPEATAQAEPAPDLSGDGLSA
jgi:DNA-binding MarR family transcriptional regulator